MKLKFLNPAPLAWRRFVTAVAVLVCLGAGAVQAADQGPRRYAEGAFDAATGTYTVVKGDDLIAIAERFGVAVGEMKEGNKLTLDKIEVGQKLVIAAAGAAGATEGKKPNIYFIMTDDVAYLAARIYHQGLMAGETPNIDRIGREGMRFTDAYSEQSCTAGRNAFMTGMNPLRTGLIVPQLPGSPSWGSWRIREKSNDLM